MQLLNYTRLKTNVELIHKHPLTLCSNATSSENKDCNTPSYLLGATVSCLGCGKMSDPQEGKL